MRKATLLFGLVALLFVLTACSATATTSTPAPPSTPSNVPTSTLATLPPAPTASPAATGSIGSEYRIAATVDAPTLHPFKRTDTASDAYIALLFTRSLWRYNPQTLEPEPWAAESWTVSDDKKTYTFKLHEMKWSDGQPVTAYDWQWTFEQAMKPENNWPYRSNAVSNIASYKALDNRNYSAITKLG